MKQIELNGSVFLLVEVPEDAHDIQVGKNLSLLIFSSSIQDPLNTGGDWVNIHPGNWELIGKASEIKEDQAAGIVEKENDGSDSLRCWWYKNYISPDVCFKSPSESLSSLLRSNSFEPNKTVILKLIK